MILTPSQLKAISPGTPLDRINEFLPHLNTYLPQYGIDTPIEVASFLAQVLHESGGFKWMREIWGPTAAQLKYEGRADLGNTIKGDGKLFMGRGPIQLTGRKNYDRMSMDMFGDDRLLKNPDMLVLAQYGIWSSCIYWKWRKMDAIDDDLSIKQETKKVNGGYNGLDDRQKYFNRALTALGAQQ
jgi:putative chitinase